MKFNQYPNKMIFFKTLNVTKIVLCNNETLEDYLLKNKYPLIKK